MLVQLEDWRQYVKEGGEYLRTAEEAARKRPEVFTPEILYNLAGIAIEKYIMGYLMYHGDLAENHTMADLARALELHAGSQPELRAELLFIDSFQEICDIDHFNRRPPNAGELTRILATAGKIRQFVTAATGN